MAGGKSMLVHSPTLISTYQLVIYLYIGQIQRLTRAHAGSVSGIPGMSEAEKKSSVGMYIIMVYCRHT